MNPRLQEARSRLEKLKTEYRRGLRPIDALLRAAVAQDPANRPEAEATQRSYGEHGFEMASLAALEQPGGPEPVREVVPPTAEPEAALEAATAPPVWLQSGVTEETAAPEAEHEPVHESHQARKRNKA